MPAKMESTQAIVCEKLRFSYDLARPLFEGASFRLATPGFHAVFGKSGVGKSTLAKILSGLLQGWKADAFVKPKRVLYCHARERLPSWQSARRHLSEVVATTGSDLQSLLRRFGLDERTLDLYPSQFSSGQHSRLNVLRYIMQPFDFLILDEALNNVDEPTRLEILSTIKASFPDRTFLYLSHQLLDVVAFSKSILFIRETPRCAEVSELEGLDLPVYSSEHAHQLADRMAAVMNHV